MAPHSSTLAWKILWKEEPGGLQSVGSLRVGQDWATSLSLFAFMHWRRKRQPTPLFLPGESQGRGSLGGLPFMGSHRVGHDWHDLAAAAAYFPYASIVNIYITTSKKKRVWTILRKMFHLTVGQNKRMVCCCSSVAQSCPALCDSMDCSMPGFLVLHHLLEFAQTQIHWVSDAIQLSHPPLQPSPSAPSLSQDQGLIYSWRSEMSP